MYNPSASAYQYDNRGNLTQDNHKGFAIAYNHLNLPKTMTKGADVIMMTYTADGEKLTKLISETNVRYYVSGIEYLATNLNAIYHAEGRCVPNGATAFHYEYSLKDHLGNARVNFRANGTAVAFIEDMHYYPFGMQMEGMGTQNPANKYLYNGKERNDDLGLNWSDYGFRWQDGALGKWWSTDMLAEEYFEWSPYNYVKNTPINGIDPDGRFPVEGREGFGAIQKSDSGVLPEVVITAKRIQPNVRQEFRSGDYRLYQTDIAWYYEKQVAGSDFKRLEYRIGFDQDNDPQMVYHISMWQENMYGVADMLGRGMFEIGAFVTMGPLEGLLAKAVVFRAATVGRVFYSGVSNPRVLEAATEFATKNGMTTINMTRAGKNLEKLTNGLPVEVSSSMWNRLSAQFAKGAKGKVHVFQNARELSINSTWGKVEYPILKSKEVKIIYHIVD